MPEIKFRAWHKDGHWVPVFHITPYGAVMDMRTHCTVEITDDVTLVQYTGLKDSNGKEIYAGDIIKSGDFVWPMRWVDNTGDMEIGMIGFSVRTWQSWKIIGNIYENSDLLK